MLTPPRKGSPEVGVVVPDVVVVVGGEVVADPGRH